jgi:glucokinase
MSETPNIPVIGVDIGGTSIKFAVVDLEKGKVLKETSCSTPNGSADEIASLVARHTNVLLHSYPDITEVGLGVPGSMNEERTLVHYPPNFTKWTVEPFAEMVASKLAIIDKVVMDNDAKAAALAEMHYGAAVGEKYFLMATLGTGVGGAIVCDGKIFRGATGGAGEFGHVIIDHNGPMSLSGIPGVLEGYIGQRYLSNRAIERLAKSKKESSLRALAANGELEPKHLSAAAEEGDAIAIELLAEAGKYLGVAMATVTSLLDIRLFIVSGGVSQAGNFLLEPARKALHDHVLEHQRGWVEIRTAKLGIRAGVVGAALLTK